MGRFVRIGTILALAGAMCGCSSVTGPLAPSSTAAMLGDLMALVPEDAQVLMGMGSSDRAQVMASAELGTYRGTRLTVVAVCQGEGNLRLALDHGGGMEVSCDQGIATIDIPVTPEARPGTVSIALERGNTYSTLVYSADPGRKGAQR